MNDAPNGIFRRRSVKFLVCALAAYAVSCLVIGAMEVTRVALSGIPWEEYAADLKGRSFFTISPLFALCLVFLWCLTGRLAVASILLGGFSFFLLFVHLKKMEILEQPLVSGDFTQVREALGVTEAVFAGHWGLILGALAAVCAAVCLLVFLLRRKPLLTLKTPFRLAYVLIFAAALLLEIHHPWLNAVFAMQKVSTVGWSLERNLDRNGLLLSLILDAREVVWRPADTSREAVERALGGRTPPDESERQSASASWAEEDRPDILLILGEAFWDVTQLPNVHFSRDPLPRFHEFQRDAAFRHASMLTPSFAGQTGNAEFEVLTGIPLAVLPPAATPYSSYIRRPLETIATHLKSFGYTTEAIHNYYGFYYRRESIYPWLGIDRFTAIDELSPVTLPGTPPAGKNLKEIKHLSREHGFDALYDGAFPSDEPLMARVMEVLEQPQKPPRFVFAITVTSHGRYLGRRFPAPEVTVSGEGLSAGSIHELENYANVLYRTDMALGWLLDRLRERKRPTLVAFFGDHLPGLTAEAYAEGGMVWDNLELNKHMTPAFLWSNRPLPQDALPADAPLGAHYLGLSLLKAAGAPLTGYFAALGALQSSLPAIGHGRIRDGAGEWFTGDDTGVPLSQPAQEALRRRDDLFLLAYDRLFGRQFSMIPGGLSDDDYRPGSFIEKEGPFWKKAGRASGAAPQAQGSGRKAAAPR